MVFSQEQQKWQDSTMMLPGSTKSKKEQDNRGNQQETGTQIVKGK
jgi:hypothetical protein